MIQNILLGILIILIAFEANNLAKILGKILQELQVIHNAIFLDKYKD